MTAILAVAAVLVAALLAVELLLRRRGFASFPLFEHNAHGGYRMRPNQAGSFLRRHDWRYDANGMRNDDVPPDFADTTVLVGDSIVDGGIRIGQAETLGALVARHSGEKVYTTACHGWSLANSLPALRALPGWARAKRLVFVLNTGDLDTVGYMESELSFPRRRPLWLTLWLARRQAYRRLPWTRLRGTSVETPEHLAARARVVRASNMASFREMLAAYGGPVVLVRYAMRDEDARGELFFEQLAALDERVRLLEAADAPGWSDECYSDHIHPSARGLEVLAPHICRGIG